ncbi:Metal transporter CNNM2 [Hypsibius exemplaris]|uniref:Metal transporter CNNM2 n=1 Tax=Hypsibius exemplaris TaxID=2072580 RepID=A0A1W0X011_HYPEX|nr:Metal transporter CNNM2 [Hypsibius exemplaris]
MHLIASLSLLLFVLLLPTCSAAAIAPRQQQKIPSSPRAINLTESWLITPSLSGIRQDSESSGGLIDGILQIYASENVTIRLFGRNLSANTSIKFTPEAATRDSSCDDLEITGIFVTGDDQENVSNDSATIMVNLNLLPDTKAAYFICVLDPITDDWKHQGTHPYLKIHTIKQYFIPLWLQIVFVALLQLLSGLFSGLNLGLLSLDPTELQIVASVGSAKDRIYAKHIIPLRTKGNFLLCSLVIANALANSILTILLDNLTSGLYAVIFSTIGIVLFGEIVPQALCNRFGLAIGSATRYITYVVMVLTCIASYPLSRLLELLLGREIGTVYDRERLVELIRVTMDHNKLEKGEANIISGTLSLKNKKVLDIMTPLDDVFMLPYDAVLDFDTLSEITREAFTRIPVFENNRANIVGLLNIKDLALLDPDDCTAVKTLCKYYSYELCFVIGDTTLDFMLEDFKKGRSHMAFIQQYTSEKDRDPAYETIGVVTLEDIIEEMIQAEIYDESDMSSQDKSKKLARKDMNVFSSRPLYQSLITPQLQHAAFQFLSTTVEPFRDEMISEQILRRLIRHGEVARLIRRKPTDVEPVYIYQAGKPADFFVLVLEGRVEVKIGYEGLIFESGPFTHFGVSAQTIPSDELLQLRNAPFPALPSPRPSQARLNLERSSNSGLFVPDFTVYAISDVLFLRIKRSHYMAAVRATILERQGKADQDAIIEDTFGEEMDRLAKEENAVPVGLDFLPAVDSLTRKRSQLSIQSSSRVPSISVTPVIETTDPRHASTTAELIEMQTLHKS